MPRINFVSFTFLFAFGLGSFVGVALGLLAVAVATPEAEPTIVEVDPAAVVEAPTATPTPTLIPTLTPTPVPVPRTLATLQVHIGPDEEYAVLGTLASGSELDVQGRDISGDWLAIEFPPGSSARGWLPANVVSGLTLVQISRLDVLQASLIETTPRQTFATPTAPTIFDGNDGLPTVTDTPSRAATASPTRSPTPTPQPVIYSSTDLALGDISLGADGRVRVVVINLGPGDVPGSSLTVSVSAQGLGAETLSGSGDLLANASTLFVTSALTITSPADVTVVIDPGLLLTDTARGNNSRSVSLAP
jgi:hypothetical protein